MRAIGKRSAGSISFIVKHVSASALLLASSQSFAFESQLELCQPIERCDVKFADQAPSGDLALFVVTAPSPRFEGGPGLEYSVGEVVDTRTNKSIFIYSRQPNRSHCSIGGGGANGAHGNPECVAGGEDVADGSFVESPAGQLLFTFNNGKSHFDLCFNEHPQLNFNRRFTVGTRAPTAYPAAYDPYPVTEQAGTTFQYRLGRNKSVTVNVGEAILGIETVKNLPIFDRHHSYNEGIDNTTAKRVRVAGGYRYFWHHDPLHSGQFESVELFLRLDGVYDTTFRRACNVNR